MLMPHLSIAENLFMGRELGKTSWTVDKKAQNRARGSCWPTSAWTSSRTPVWNASR